jgi:hypothetical protein
VEDGTPTQLLQRSMGIFSSMLRASQEGAHFAKNGQDSQRIVNYTKMEGKDGSS